MVIDEWWRRNYLTGNSCGIIDVPWGTGENQEKPVNIADDLAEIRRSTYRIYESRPLSPRYAMNIVSFWDVSPCGLADSLRDLMFPSSE
jgi:hypothetical protein